MCCEKCAHNWTSLMCFVPIEPVADFLRRNAEVTKPTIALIGLSPDRPNRQTLFGIARGKF